MKLFPTTGVPHFSQEVSDVLLKLVELPKFLLPGHPGESLPQGSAQGTESDRAEGAAGRGF